MVIWTSYLRYRAELRGFDLLRIEEIVRFSGERYLDTSSHRRVAVGQHGDQLVMIPYDQDGEKLTPVTIHATTRHQLKLRLRTERFQP